MFRAIIYTIIFIVAVTVYILWTGIVSSDKYHIMRYCQSIADGIANSITHSDDKLLYANSIGIIMNGTSVPVQPPGHYTGYYLRNKIQAYARAIQMSSNEIIILAAPKERINQMNFMDKDKYVQYDPTNGINSLGVAVSSVK